MVTITLYARQQKRHRYIEQSFGLWERARVGWFGRMALKHVYHMWNESPSHLPPHTFPLGHPSAPAPSILYHALNLDWWFVSYMILYMFPWHSPKSSHPLLLPQSPKDFCTSVSLLPSCIQGYCYHLSKFHIYALVYCIGVFLSDFLHSV